jgi:glycosyltransferase involved in cell wall biosynthesis
VKDGKFRILHLCEHPVQYNTVLWRQQAAHPKLDILVAYCDLRGSVPAMNQGFGVEVAWDVPLLEGYPWIVLPPAPGGRNGHRRFALRARALWRLVKDGGFDAVCLGGYYFREAWEVILAAKREKIPIVLCTDAHRLESRRAKTRFALTLKKMIAGRIYRMAGAVITSSSEGSSFVQSLGVPAQRIFMGGSVVDNGWWLHYAAQVDRAAVGREWGVPIEAQVVLFCAKLQPWKRPSDVLEAFSRAGVPGSYLVFAGDGPLRGSLEQRSRDLGVADRVRFLGFVNQTHLPAVYVASDLLVLPSDYEPFGLVVNEAMLCGCPAVVSDRVGAGYDLVSEGETGCVFPCGDIETLAQILRSLLGDPTELDRMGTAAKQRVRTWSPESNIAAFIEAVEAAVASE